jgi:asparagine synthetase B (glutamine-hydrolysing)
VRLRLMADVPLGMFLSGGIDSSAVAAIMARQMDRPVETFSVAFADRQYSELEYARQAADSIGAVNHEIVISDDDFFAALPRLIWHEDEPIAHPSSVPLHFVSALARQHVKVVLTGEGSDELLGGYGKYPRTLLNWKAGTIYEHMLPARVRSALAASVVSRLPGRAGALARRSFLAVPRRPADMFLDTFASVPMRLQRSLLNRGVLAGSDPYAPSLEYFARVNGTSTLLDRLLYTDIKTYLVELLMKQDQMSMSMSIESRVPFLDHKLVEVRGPPAAAPEARWLDHQARTARGHEGHRAARDPHAAEDGIPRAVRRMDAQRLERRRARDPARSPGPRARPDQCRRGLRPARRPSRRTPKRRRRHLGPDESRALVPHVYRRWRHSDVAGSMRGCQL